MNDSDKIKALAELDGWKHEQFASQFSVKGKPPLMCDKWNRGRKGIDAEQIYKLPSYLASYDAIIPLVQKQTETIQDEVAIRLEFPGEYSGWFWNATPIQLADALLVATGKMTP